MKIESPSPVAPASTKQVASPKQQGIATDFYEVVSALLTQYGAPKQTDENTEAAVSLGAKQQTNAAQDPRWLTLQIALSDEEQDSPSATQLEALGGVTPLVTASVELAGDAGSFSLNSTPGQGMKDVAAVHEVQRLAQTAAWPSDSPTIFPTGGNPATAATIAGSAQLPYAPARSYTTPPPPLPPPMVDPSLPLTDLFDVATDRTKLPVRSASVPSVLDTSIRLSLIHI